MTDPRTQADRLVSQLRCYTRPVVAFSGGVDSAVVAQAAALSHGADALAITSVGPALAENERAVARQVARQIGIRHEELSTAEWRNPAYVRNAPDRCFHCKSELYGTIRAWLEAAGEEDRDILSGANQDDLGDYRPGLEAASRHQIQHPLVACGMGKEDVRSVARFWGLPVWDKPAAPCLASRVAYGVEVTPQRLRRVERAEELLRATGFRVVRVRVHAEEMARIEVPREEIGQLVAVLDERLVQQFKELGFRRVTVDMDGFRSGNLNELVPVEALAVSVAKPAPGRDT